MLAEARQRGVLQGKMRQIYLETLTKKLYKKLQLFAELEIEKQHKFPKSTIQDVSHTVEWVIPGL